LLKNSKLAHHCSSPGVPNLGYILPSQGTFAYLKEYIYCAAATCNKLSLRHTNWIYLKFF